MKNIAYSAIIVLLGLGLQSCSTAEADNKTETAKIDSLPVKIMTVNEEFVQNEIHASGQFSTDDETVLSFKTGGIVSSVFVTEGEKVKRGDLLAKLDLTEIAAQVSQAQLGLEKALRDYKRAENLYNDSVATLEQFQNAKTGLDIAAQQLNAAKFNLAYSEIRAVSDGYVLKKFANAGQTVAPGTPIFQTNGGGKSTWILKVGVSDKEWVQIKINDKAEIMTDANPEKKIIAVVRSKSESADPVNGSFTIELKVTELNQTSLASGLYGKAVIYPSERKRVWLIPYEALLDGNGNNGFVFITTDQKTATKIPVTIDGIENKVVRIRSGLKPNSQLIVSGSAYLSDQSPIAIIK